MTISLTFSLTFLHIDIFIPLINTDHRSIDFSLTKKIKNLCMHTYTPLLTFYKRPYLASYHRSRDIDDYGHDDDDDENDET